MGCKGVCVRHKPPKRDGVNVGRYESGQKRCNICEIFVEWDGIFCPCCGYRLRTRPRNKRYRMELQQKTMQPLVVYS